MPAEAVLRVAGLHKSFHGVKALQGVDLSLRRGERRAVIGPNGAGKSTLFRVISGETRPTAGDVFFRGWRITGGCPEAAASLGLSRTFQHSSLFPELTAQDNAALAVLARRPGRWNVYRPLRDYPSVVAEAAELLATVGLQEKAGVPAAALSHGERRLLEVAMALARRPVLLLLDEPVAGLVGAERIRVQQVLRALPREMTVLLIEHDLEFAFGLVDTVTVLHRGQVVAEGSPAQVRADPVVQEAYLGTREIPVRPAPLSPRANDAVLIVEGLHAGYGDAPVLQGCSLEVGRGEVVALLGRNGMGKTTTLHTLAGFLQPRAGRILLGGRDVTGASPLALAEAHVALVPQGRRTFPELTVEEQLLLGARPGRWTVERVYELFPSLRERRTVTGTSLSGGEQQMLAIGRALLRNPRVLLLDEPSEGLSPLLVRVMADVIGALRDEGETILLAEQNVNMALSVADRVYVLERGRVIYEGAAREFAVQRALIHGALGVNVHPSASA